MGRSKTPILDFLFGNRAKRDQYRPSTVAKNMISPINSYGHCFSCEGTGSKELTCRACHGTGTFNLRGRHVTCRRCDGHGTFKVTCRKCGGSGWHKFKG